MASFLVVVFGLGGGLDVVVGGGEASRWWRLWCVGEGENGEGESQCGGLWWLVLATIGAPEDLAEVITGFAETGEALVSSADKVIFVGSPGVGKMIMRNAAETLIPVTLELGGKDAFIVCEDVDVDHVRIPSTFSDFQRLGCYC